MLLRRCGHHSCVPCLTREPLLPSFQVLWEFALPFVRLCRAWEDLSERRDHTTRLPVPGPLSVAKSLARLPAPQEISIKAAKAQHHVLLYLTLAVVSGIQACHQAVRYYKAQPLTHISVDWCYKIKGKRHSETAAHLNVVDKSFQPHWFHFLNARFQGQESHRKKSKNSSK